MSVLQLFRRVVAVMFLGVCLCILGCETSVDTKATSADKSAGPAKTTPTRPVAPPDDPLKPGDKIKIDFQIYTSSSPIPPHEETVKDDGSIHLDLIGDVQAGGLNARQLEKVIHDKYVPDYYKRITIVVTPDNRYFYVGGEVKQPNRQLYTGNMTVTRAIQSSGDFTDFADRKKVVLTRANGERTVINITDARKDPKKDLPVYPGDSIHVPQSLY
jgi:protein involved in polysaccharide export with SLBB domain